jgi:hypothetical protein
MYVFCILIAFPWMLLLWKKKVLIMLLPSYVRKNLNLKMIISFWFLAGNW